MCPFPPIHPLWISICKHCTSNHECIIRSTVIPRCWMYILFVRYSIDQVEYVYLVCMYVCISCRYTVNQVGLSTVKEVHFPPLWHPREYIYQLLECRRGRGIYLAFKGRGSYVVRELEGGEGAIPIPPHCAIKQMPLPPSTTPMLGFWSASWLALEESVVLHFVQYNHALRRNIFLVILK